VEGKTESGMDGSGVSSCRMKDHRPSLTRRSPFKRERCGLLLLLVVWGCMGCGQVALRASDDLEPARQKDKVEKQSEELWREVREADEGLVAADWELTAKVVTEVVEGEEVHKLVVDLKNISGKRRMLNYTEYALFMYDVQVRRAGKSVLINPEALSEGNTLWFAPGEIFRCAGRLDKAVRDFDSRAVAGAHSRGG
jgi:hypothetical protein